jgi:NTE family protein
MAGTAIVLSGGGSMGDFEVGALHYLYQKGVRPDLLCTTSVGSVNGLKLAEGETGPDAGLAGLTSLWLSLTSSDEFFAEADWLQGEDNVSRFLWQLLRDFASALPTPTAERLAVNDDLQQLSAAEADAVKARRAEIVVDELKDLDQLATIGVLLPSPLGVVSTLEFAVRVVTTVAAVVGVASGLITESSLLTLLPLEALARAKIDTGKVAQWAAAGGRLRMATVALESGELWYVTESQKVERRDGTLLLGAAAPVPAACQALANALGDAEAELTANLQLAARGDLPGGMGELARLRRAARDARAALDACVARQPPAGKLPITIDLVTGMVASASIPVYFPPRLVGSENCVDGGIRAVMPVEAALSSGADPIYAIHASRSGLDWESGPGGFWPMYASAYRSLPEIAIDEIAYRDGHPIGGPLPGKFMLIEPQMDIHTIFTVYPAFVRQRMAYGWMCAADEIDPPADVDRARQIAFRISALRYGIARLECWSIGRPVPPFLVTMPLEVAERLRLADTIAAMQQEVHALVDERVALGAKVPAGISDWDDPQMWWHGEVHPGQIGQDDAFVDGTSLPASVTAGSAAPVAVSVTNRGTTSWDPAAGYRLGSYEPPDNTTWGPTRAELPAVVHPGQAIRLTFTVTAPARLGPTPCVWRMVRDG